MKAIKRATLKEIKKAVKTLNNEEGEIFYINNILPFDKRSINEILKEEQ
jgi:pyruvate/2-oxoacid:ferredoxin oxidoreductase alpha subunit